MRRQVPYPTLVRLAQVIGRASPNGVHSWAVTLTAQELASLRLLVEQEKERQRTEAELRLGLAE